MEKFFLGTRKKNSDQFWIKKEGNNCWLGHQHGETEDIHEIKISKSLYDAFVKEIGQFFSKSANQ